LHAPGRPPRGSGSLHIDLDLADADEALKQDMLPGLDTPELRLERGPGVRRQVLHRLAEHRAALLTSGSAAAPLFTGASSALRPVSEAGSSSMAAIAPARL
jgi:hypothetical protein